VYIYHDTFGDSKPCVFVGMYVYILKYVIYVCLSVRVVSYSGSGSIILEFKSVCQTVESISASCDDCHWFIKRGKCVI